MQQIMMLYFFSFSLKELGMYGEGAFMVYLLPVEITKSERPTQSFPLSFIIIHPFVLFFEKLESNAIIIIIYAEKTRRQTKQTN